MSKRLILTDEERQTLGTGPQAITRLILERRRLRKAALGFLEAERSYHKAHLKGEAGPGVCKKAKDADRSLAKILGVRERTHDERE